MPRSSNEPPRASPSARVSAASPVAGVEAAAVHFDELAVATGAGTVDRLGEQFLAGAGLAGDQHRGVGRGDHVRLGEAVLHQRAAGGELRAPVVRLGVGEARGLERAPHFLEQLLLLDRLGEERERARLRGLHCVRNGAVRGEHDDVEARPLALQFLEQRDAVHLCHAQVGDHEVGAEARHRRECLGRAGDGLHFVFLRAQADGEQAQQPRVVVHDQDARRAAEAGHGSGEAASLARGWPTDSGSARPTRRTAARWRARPAAPAASACRWPDVRDAARASRRPAGSHPRLRGTTAPVRRRSCRGIRPCRGCPPRGRRRFGPRHRIRCGQHSLGKSSLAFGGCSDAVQELARVLHAVSQRFSGRVGR